jgi:hypothetical protein
MNDLVHQSVIPAVTYYALTIQSSEYSLMVVVFASQ